MSHFIFTFNTDLVLHWHS